MKNTIKFLTIILLAITFQSCDSLTDLADVNFDTTINEKIAFHVDQYQEVISESITLSIDKVDTHDYLNHLETVSITKFTYKIIDFHGDEEGSLDVTFFIDGVSLSQESFFVKQANDDSSIFEITDTNKLNTIASALKNNHQITASISGNSASINESMDFKVDITINLSMVANPL
jgi:hypothetical protein